MAAGFQQHPGLCCTQGNWSTYLAPSDPRCLSMGLYEVWMGLCCLAQVRAGPEPWAGEGEGQRDGWWLSNEVG